MPIAARLTHIHHCSEPSPPHFDGPIVTGSPMVLTVGFPATRLVDQILCCGVDAVAQGSSTVLIDGLPASRKSDLSSHGGVMVGADVNDSDVLIGGPAVTIKVKGDPKFIQDVQDALAKLLPTRSGLKWLEGMAASGRTVTIVPSTNGRNRCDPDNAADAKNGTGTDSTIQWDPEKDDHPGFNDHPGSDVLLSHEMVHSLHDATGTDRNGPADWYDGQQKGATSARNDERSTVGLGGPVRQPDGTQEPNPPDYSKQVPTENSFRDDLGVPRRQSYYSPKMPGGAPW